MSKCINCGDTYTDREKRRGNREYLGYYCNWCETFRQDEGRLPQPEDS